MTVQDICSRFTIGGKYIGCKQLDTGNINSTYMVSFIRGGEDKKYALQKINKTVFKEPERVMDNIVRVTNYVHDNIVKMGLSTKKFVLHVFFAKDGRPFVIDDAGNYWRCYRFIKDSVTYDSVDDLEVIRRAGEAFGRFQNCLDGFDAGSLYITIPDFHNTKKRFETFREAVVQDVCDRAKTVEKEIKELFALEEKAIVLQNYLEKGLLPLRVTHNDTKCNNVSFDKNTGEALAVLDLDTVMPGLVAHDFGDAIRFIANSVIEDDPDIEKVSLNLEKYTAFAKGFLSQVKASLTDFEKKTINSGVLAMTVELAVRFLTDYLNGDTYFKINYPGHNVDRARNQTALAIDIDRKMPVMDDILQNIL